MGASTLYHLAKRGVRAVCHGRFIPANRFCRYGHRGLDFCTSERMSVGTCIVQHAIVLLFSVSRCCLRRTQMTL
jgi:hypothetical protein